MSVISESDYRDLCTALTWYEHIPAQWKIPGYCRDPKVFERIRAACLAYERLLSDPTMRADSV